MPKNNFVPLPGQGLEPQNYKFNAATSWPKEVNDQVANMLTKFQGKPLGYNQHADDRGNQTGGNNFLDEGQHGIHPTKIPNVNGRFPSAEAGWRPVEVEHDGHNVTKMLMRGPYSDTHDAVMPIVPGRDGNPFATSAWANENTDNHDTLDLNRVHLPEEFKMGKRPKRRLLSREETKRPGYVPVPHHRQKSRDRIISQYGYPQVPPQGQQQVAYYLPNILDYNFLKEALKRYRK